VLCPAHFNEFLNDTVYKRKNEMKVNDEEKVNVVYNGKY